MENKVIFTETGDNKTFDICKEAIQKAEISKKYVLILAHTYKGVETIDREYRKQNKGVIDFNVVIKTWRDFLLADWIKPCQCLLKLKDEYFNDFEVPENFIQFIDFDNEHNKDFKSSCIWYYINEKTHNVRENRMRHLSYVCNSHSQNKIIDRLTEIYSHIFIDEVQEYVAGYDLKLFNLLFKSKIDIICVGNYKSKKIIDYFKLKEEKKECVIEYSSKNIYI